MNLFYKVFSAMLVALTASQCAWCAEPGDNAGGDLTLNISGNANMDDTIDESDVLYLQDIINGSRERTELADANNDSVIDQMDIEQTQNIIKGDEKELTFIDYDGVTVTVKMPVKTIVTTGHEGLFEGIRVLQCEDQIIGIEEEFLKENKRILSDLINLPSVGTTSELDVEKIIELKPDIVIVGPRYSMDEELERKLSGTDIQVARVMLSDGAAVLPQMMILGYILDKNNESQAYRVWHDTVIEGINERVSAIPQDTWPRVLYTQKWNQITYAQSGSCAYHHTLEQAGGTNIAKDLQGNYIEVDSEWVMEENPDAIVAVSHAGGYESDNSTPLKNRFEEITGTPEFENLKAVKDGKVFVAHPTILVSPAYPVGVAYIAKWFYTELFTDLDPQALHQEYLNKFQGFDFDLNKQGAFVYPRPA